MRSTKRLSGLIFFLFCGLSPSGWATDGLVVYSGRNDKFVDPVMAEFTKQTGIKVQIHNSKASSLINRMKLEGSKTKADLFLSNDAGTLQIGSDMGLFLSLKDSLVHAIEPRYRGDENRWVGLSARARVLVYNKAFINELRYIKSVFDLADPRLLGKVAITDSANGSFIDGITVYMKVVGPEKTLAFLKGLKSNTAGKVYSKHGKIVEEVAAGKKIIGLVNHYYIYRYLEKHPTAPIEILIPDQGDQGMGVAWNVTGIAVSKHTKKLKEAEKLVEFLVSEKGQALFSAGNQEYPVRQGVSPPKGMPANYKVAKMPMIELGKSRNKTLDLIEKIGLY